MSILENSEKLSASTSTLYGTLYEGERSIHDLLVIVRNQLRDLVSIDKQFESAAAESESAVAIVGELAKFIQRYSAGVEYNPGRLEELRQRLGRLALLKKKYGGSIESILVHRERIGQEAALAENFDEVLARLNKDLEERRSACAVKRRERSTRQSSES
ncbi:MAG: repair protein RecN [Bacteroidetes bacterium]|nr:repair protein RecN [Bacteroidota bacterium]